MILSNGTTRPIAPQAFAETSPLFQTGYFLAPDGMALETRFATYAQLYRTQLWVSVVVNKIADLVARLGVCVWDTRPDTGNDVDRASPLAQLMRDPCDTLDGYSFWRWIVATIEIYGEAYLVKLRDASGRPTRLLPMHPARTQIERDRYGDLVYRFMGRPDEVIPERDVIPFCRYNPDGTMRGVSRLEPLRSTLMNEDSARRATESWWLNMGRPSVVLSSDKKLGDVGRERLKRAFNSQAAGASNAGSTIVLEDGVTITPHQLSAEEMQYIDSRKLNREEVCAQYDIQPTMVGILDHATFSNIDSQRRDLYTSTVAPRTEFIESVLLRYLCSEFNGQRAVKFDMGAQLRGDFETRAHAVAKLVETGIMMPAEARPLFDLGDAGPQALRLYANAAIQPLGAPPEQLRITATVPDGEDTPDGMALEGLGASTTTTSPGQAKALKHLRAIGSAMGRGATLRQATAAQLEKHPHDRESVAAAHEQLSRKQGT